MEGFDPSTKRMEEIAGMKAGYMAVCLLLGAGMAQADQDWCRTMFDAAPSELDSAVVQTRAENADPTQGFTVTYDSSDLLTATFFDAGLDALPEGTSEQYFFLAAQEVVAGNKQLAHRPTAKPVFYRQASKDDTQPVVFRMDLSSNSETEPVINDTLFVFDWGACMVKLRLTDRIPEKEKSVERGQSILGTLIAALPARP
ncbi:hypothetical protein R3X27_01280 [Tropicimonas sp. TH_r6]|uniref:hypothetical protein n=1 Tax=Tropicimonas sp. TH_r6 TaxID=3082085 RepID=UPI0029554DD9|nr:hypothetical protein [Tropicimonas sp. TH_r6]MDV7141305.1 hypothetical protein [Tropicimonas sp. TH_r6]